MNGNLIPGAIGSLDGKMAVNGVMERNTAAASNLARAIRRNPDNFVATVVKNNPDGVKNWLATHGYAVNKLSSIEVAQLIINERRGAIDGVPKDISGILSVPYRHPSTSGVRMLRPGIQPPNAQAGRMAPPSGKSIQFSR